MDANQALTLLIWLFCGFIAAYVTIPLTAFLWGVTITVTGAGTVAGMYLYALTALIIAMVILIVGWLIKVALKHS